MIFKSNDFKIITNFFKDNILVDATFETSLNEYSNSLKNISINKSEISEIALKTKGFSDLTHTVIII